MNEIRERYARIAANFGATLQNAPAGTWDAPSPCEQWTAFDVAAHVIIVHRGTLAALDGSEVSEPEKGEDLNRAWDEVMTGVVDALDNPELAQKTTGKGAFSEQPFENIVGGVLCADTLLHTWDLARATGQDDKLDAGGVDKAMTMLRGFGDQMRRPGGFGPEIPADPDADEQTKLLHFAGRQT